jgi:hypothetical protein
MKRGLKTTIAGVVVLLVGAFVIPLAFFLPVALGNSHDFQFKAPGSAETMVNEPGRYYLWNDFRTVYEGKSYDRSPAIPDGVEIQIRDAMGRQLQFVSDTSISMTSGGSSKKSIGYVEIAAPGKVKILLTGGNEERIFSFSQSGLLKLFGLIAGGVGLSLVVCTVGLGLIIWGVVKLATGVNKVESSTSR